MSIQVHCPSCDAQYTLGLEQEGKKVRCKKCATIFTVAASPGGRKADSDPAGPQQQSKPEDSAERRVKSRSSPAASSRRRDRVDDYEDEDRPRRKKRGLSAGALFLIIGAVVGSVLVIGICIVGVVWLMTKEDKVETFNPKIQVAQGQFNQGPGVVFGPGGGPRGGQALQEDDEGDDDGEENAADPKIKEPPPPPGPPRVVSFLTPPPLEKPDGQPKGAAPTNLTPEVVKRVKQATLLLRVTDYKGQYSFGSGFFAGGRNIIITNAHVVGMLRPGSRKPRLIEVSRNSGTPEEKRFNAVLLGVDRSSDLAVLRADLADPPPPLEIKPASSLFETQKVWVFGFPHGEMLGKEITISESAVSSFRRNEDGIIVKIQVNGGVQMGNSGGPIVDGTGNVVGVAVSIIQGTQLNFAVPGDSVRNVLAGRISGVKFGAPVQKDGATKVPVTIEVIDPLRQIQSPFLEIWTGEPKPEVRAPSRTAPVGLKGDTEKQRFAFTLNNDNQGHVELSLKPLDEGRAYLIQPAWKNGAGETLWTSARVFSVPEPVTMRPALLQTRHRVGARRLVLNSWSDLKLIRQNEGEMPLQASEEAQLTESVQSIDREEQASVRLQFRSYNSEEKVQNVTRPPDKKRQQVRANIKKLSSQLQIDNQGNPVNHQFDLAHVARGPQDEISAVCASHLQAIDAVSIPLPNKQVNSGESWISERSLPYPRFFPWAQEGKLTMTYTYVGSRKRNGKEEAVVTFSGTVPLIEGQKARSTGSAEGTAVIDIDSGLVTQVDAVFSLDRELTFFAIGSPDSTFKASGTLTVRLKRTPVSTPPKA